ncbi:MAG: hypothetical protein IIA87_00765 [Nanoarchaeota archaeon]|nr:hypothetical protein [Nanoarchaeota archaeon]
MIGKEWFTKARERAYVNELTDSPDDELEAIVSSWRDRSPFNKLSTRLVTYQKARVNAASTVLWNRNLAIMLEKYYREEYGVDITPGDSLNNGRTITTHYTAAPIK